MLQTRRFAFDEYVLDTTTRRLSRGEQRLAVTGKTFDLLAHLVANAGRPLSKKELLDAIWPDSFVEEANLTQNIFILRKALGEAGNRLIQTLPGLGYQFTAQMSERPIPVAPSVESAAPLETRSFQSTETRVIYHEETEHLPFWLSPITVIACVVALVLLGVAGWLGWQRYEDRVGGPPVQVVLADLDGNTGDLDLNRTLEDILRFQLAQSPFVSVLPGSTVGATMAQMMRKPDEPLTLNLARDLCERTASQAVLHGHIARLGSSYVVVEEVTNCVDGATLGIAKQNVPRGDDLPAAMDKIGADLRHSLGESRRTIRRFNQPLQPEPTASLEAAKDYSQAVHVAQSGRFPEAIGLLKKAVELDPQFAAAYYNLAAYSSNASDPVSAQDYLKKAYELREFTSQPARFAIIANYESDITGDLYESVRNYQTWVDTYPRIGAAWYGLANTETLLGRLPEAEQAAQREFELLPGSASAYVTLASQQMQVGDYAGSRNTCDLALSRGLDTDLIRQLLLDLGHLTRDFGLIEIQEAWAEANPNAIQLMSEEFKFALQSGRIARAQELKKRIDLAFLQQGAVAAGIAQRQTSAWAYFELGEPAIASKELHVAAVNPEEVYELLALADEGQPEVAAGLLSKQIKLHPRATLLKEVYAPLLTAKVAMLKHDPTAAVNALAEVSRPNLDVLSLRAQAYLESGDLSHAETTFRTLLSQEHISPASFQIPLARLLLSRTLAAEGKDSESQSLSAEFNAEWVPRDTLVRFPNRSVQSGNRH